MSILKYLLSLLIASTGIILLFTYQPVHLSLFFSPIAAVMTAVIPLVFMLALYGFHFFKALATPFYTNPANADMAVARSFYSNSLKVVWIFAAICSVVSIIYSVGIAANEPPEIFFYYLVSSLISLIYAGVLSLLFLVPLKALVEQKVRHSNEA